MIRRLSSLYLLIASCFLILGLGMIPMVLGETEVKWTPNEDDADGGPLPLSNNQRQQLLQLEQAIVNSPDPQGTLQQAAQANQMDPQELAKLLHKNRQEMEAAGALDPQRGGGRSMRRNPVVAVSGLIMKSAAANPRAFAVTFTLLLLIAFLSWEAPRTGVVLSSSSASLFSKGRTTLWKPPVSFVQSLLESPKVTDKPVGSSPESKDTWKALRSITVDDGLTWHKAKSLAKGNKKSIQQAVTSQQTVDPEFASYLASEDTDDETFVASVTDMCVDNAVSLLNSRRLTDLSSNPNDVKFIASEEDDRFGMMVVKKMGDWGRFGLLPVKIVAEHSDENIVSMTMSTLKGAHWDGQFLIEIKRRKGLIVIQSSIVIPRPGRKVSRKIAAEIVQTVSQSLAESIRTNVKLQLARRSQSSRFQGSAQKRAKDRRRTRHEKETAIEEMAADRRRRWQRENPNAGHYRPSGDMMKSPHNAVY